MQPAAAKRLKLLASALSVMLLLAVLFAGWFYGRLRSSRPQLDGEAKVAGLSAEVRITRDALGVPTLQAKDRLDIARGLGWLHAQDRFFQMDLYRRSAAGELAEIFGPRALGRDRLIRRHGFRKIAEQVMAQVPAGERALLEAYTGGINAGLAALPARPFEYHFLRVTPQPWRATDSVLVIFAMTIDLQDENGRYEQTLMTLRDQLGLEGLAFLNPLITPQDSALDSSVAPLAPIPSPKTLDLRKPKVSASRDGRGESIANGENFSRRRDLARAEALAAEQYPHPPRDPEMVPGSNAFALSGAHTATGAAMLANDMHLDHAVPNTWYRASLEYAGRKVTGVTLPGTPAVVAGSNGQIAWGFTNSYADTGDLVLVETRGDLPGWYDAPGHPDGLKLEQRREVIRVKGADDVTVDFPWTIWGPVIGANERHQPLALRWLSHEPAATNFGLLALEEAQDVSEAVAIAHRAGIPPQNFIVADRSGDIAWTIAGRLPRRVGFDGRLPVSWRFGDRRWDGMVDPAEVPVMSTKPKASAAEIPLSDGRIWSGNQRHVGGAALALLGDGDYARPHRARQIRDGLKPLEQATPRDLLAVQLDDRALFLTPWHKLLVDTLAPAVTDAKKARERLLYYAKNWEGRASRDAVSYPLVREFRLAVYSRIFTPIFAACVEIFPRFEPNELQLESAAWALLHEKPMHLLDSKYANWDELLVAATDDVIRQVDRRGRSVPQANWGWHNTARIRHPFGNLLPSWMPGWLNMPADPLPGGADMPRVQSPGHGASERLVVSPGREDEGIFHMPGGQSAHPLSPFFAAGHAAWVRGDPTPFLPGKTVHTLRLTP